MKYYDKLVQEIIRANFHFKLWRRLEDCKVEYIHELRQANAFWVFTMQAHFDAALMHLFKVLDTHPDALSIRKFLNFVDSNSRIFSTMAFEQRQTAKGTDKELCRYQVARHCPICHQHIKEDEAKLNRLETPINNLAEWRDKVYAHIDRTALLKGTGLDITHPVPITDMDNIIVTTKEILNRYSQAFDASRWVVEMDCEEAEIKAIMEAVRFKRQELRARRSTV